MKTMNQFLLKNRNKGDFTNKDRDKGDFTNKDRGNEFFVYNELIIINIFIVYYYRYEKLENI